MLIIGGLKIKFVIYTFITGIITIIFSLIRYPFQKKRFINWLTNSNPDPTSQVERAKQALQNGGLWGNGFSDSLIKEGFMAEGHTDFILPIIAEEIGFWSNNNIFFIFYFLLFKYKNS